MMKQEYVPYNEWEDWINGMWRKLKKSDESIAIKMAIAFTGNHSLYGSYMQEVSFMWPRTMLHNLTNKSINRRAFLGHCAVCYSIGIPEYITRIAWWELTNKQRSLADAEADKYIRQWERIHQSKNKSVHIGLGAQMLFEWDTG